MNTTSYNNVKTKVSDFVHSEKIVLIDKDNRIRGYYDGTDYESVNLLIDEIKVLKWEYENN